MNAREILIKARELIADPARWTQHATARDKYGRRILSNDTDACQWCAIGALARVSGVEDRRDGEDGWGAAYDRLVALAPFGSVSCVNDNEGHAATLALFDKAVAAEGV